MNELIESIINKEYTKADEIINEELKIIVARKLNEAKKMVAAKIFTEQLNIDDKGKFHEAGGKKVLGSVEKLKRGLAEEDKPKKELSSRAQKFLDALTGEKYKKEKPPNVIPFKKLKEEKIENENGEHIGDLMQITETHAKNPTKTVKKYRAERKDGKTLITAGLS